MKTVMTQNDGTLIRKNGTPYRPRAVTSFMKVSGELDISGDIVTDGYAAVNSNGLVFAMNADDFEKGYQRTRPSRAGQQQETPPPDKKDKKK